MKLFKIKLHSKNNKQRGTYHYSTILKDGNKYYFGSSVISKIVLRAENINVNDIVKGREIPQEFYTANGII